MISHSPPFSSHLQKANHTALSSLLSEPVTGANPSLQFLFLSHAFSLCKQPVTISHLVLQLWRDILYMRISREMANPSQNKLGLTPWKREFMKHFFPIHRALPKAKAIIIFSSTSLFSWSVSRSNWCLF